MKGAWDARTLLRALGELERVDLKVTLRIRRTMWSALISALLALACGVAWFFAWFPHAREAFAGLVAMTFLLNWLFRKAREADIPDEIRLTIQPVIRQLLQDIDASRKIKFDLQLKRPVEEKLDKHVERVCSLQLPLADGSTAIFHITNRYRSKVRRYRNKNGKYKSKTKWKKKSTLTGILVPAPGVTWRENRIERELQRRRETLQMIRRAGGRAARMSRRYKFLSLGELPKDVVPAEDVVDLFLRLALGRAAASG